MAVAQSTLKAELERVGIRMSVDEFQHVVLEALRQLPSVVESEDPARELTKTERDVLIEGGGVLEKPVSDPTDPRARTAAHRPAAGAHGQAARAADDHRDEP